MDIREIKMFIEVADHNSFTKAAEHSYLSQPSLSKAVRKLEEELQVELFDRSTRHLRLTDAGRIVYQQGRRALASLNELATLLDELRNVETGELRIGIPPLIGTLFFPDIARRFHAAYPKVKLQLVELGAKRITQIIDDNQIDLGIIVLPVDEEKFNLYPFITDEFVLYIHTEHRLAQKQSITLSELKDEKFILFTEDFTLHDVVIKACNEAGFEPIVSYESTQWDLIVELVSSRMGITILPKLIFNKQNHANIKMIPIKEPSLLWRLGIITKKDAYHSYALKKLLEMLTT
ncbi:LysR family transcriptional regulator [Bacillus sp. FJAT-49736]|uniref:LysR family transcriptional regulator n=1 Tax=Bacillus sp. FJAT-49736 TaxID=2833582 RepID=UPI001BC8EA53|nr:LysR family transcriptional regulator [Bacillus sp. FJAT-49736]MBS4174215.1 LysR family transcriptional regulator [Bacillus sp. FJAT-49736]